MSSIEAEIAEEERLIEIYEAELALLKRKERLREPVEEENWNFQEILNESETKDPLEWIMEQQEASVSSLLESLKDNKREDSVLQPYLRAFAFTSVERIDQSTSGTKANYEMKGYFTKRPELKATINFEFQLKGDNREARILSLDCKLNQKGYGKLDRNQTLAHWLDKITQYIEFDDKRKAALQMWKDEGLVRQEETNQSQTTLSFGVSPESEQSISLVWVWKWKENRDVLRFTSESARLGLKQVDLDYLVQACGSCDAAIAKMLPTEENINAKSNKHQPETPVECDADDEVSIPHKADASRESSYDSLSEHEDDNLPTSPSGRKLSEYEIFRLQRIERNKQKLVELGLEKRSVVPDAKPKKRYKKKRKQLSAVVKPLPKRSKILGDVDDTSGVEEDGSFQEVSKSLAERVGENGCIQPAKAPEVAEDGTFVRPRGRAPLGYDWNQFEGVWMPMEGLDMNSIHRKSGKAALQLKFVDRIDEDGCIRPAGKLVQKFDGTYNRPRGRLPIGFKWDMFRGVYVPEDKGIKDSREAVSKGSRAEPDDVDGTSKTPGVPRNIEVDHDLFSPGAVSGITARLSIATTATKETRLAERHESNRSKGTTSSEPRDGKREDSDKPSKPVKVPVSERTREDGSVVPSVAPSRNPDGTFKQPRGKPMKDFDWDYKCGVWRPKNSSAEASNAKTTTSKNVSKPFSVENVPNSEQAADATHGSAKSGVASTTIPAHSTTKTMKRNKSVRDRTLADGSIRPKATPKKSSDGTYERPRGKALKGHEWDRGRGIWVPQVRSIREVDTTATPAKRDQMPSDTKPYELEDMDQTATNSTVTAEVVDVSTRGAKGSNMGHEIDDNKQSETIVDSKNKGPSKLDSQISKPKAKTMKSRTLPDGSVQPNRTPTKNADGTYKAPRGKQIIGHSWDKVRGVWQPEKGPHGQVTQSSPSKLHDKEGEVSSQKFSVDKEHRESESHAEVHSSRGSGKKTKKSNNVECRTLEDGTILPKVVPSKQPDGTFKTPRGKRKKGYGWDDIRGVWVPDSKRDSGIAEVGVDKGEEHSDEKAPAKVKRVSAKARTLDDGCVRPLKEPSRKADGSYSAPPGKPMKGYTWNAIRGVWQPGTEESTANDFQLKQKASPPPSALRDIVVPKSHRTPSKVESV